MINVISIIGTVVWAVSLALVLLSALIGLLGGLKKGAYHTAVKLGARIVSVAISLGITVCLRGVIVGLISDILLGQFPGLEQYASLIELGAHLPTSVLLLVVFGIIYMIVGALMKIPQKIICKHLPKTFDEALEAHQASAEKKKAKKAESADSVTSVPTSEGEQSAAIEDAPTAPVADEAAEAPSGNSPVEEITAVEVEVPRHIGGKLAWYTTAILCGMLSSVLALGLFWMPLASTLVRFGGTLDRITEVMLEEKGDWNDAQEELKLVHEFNKKTLLSPLFTVSDFFYGKLVYEPIIDFNTDFGRISLTGELNNVTDMTCKLIPIVASITAEGDEKELTDEEAKVLADVTRQASESKFLMTAGSLGVRLFADVVAGGKIESEAMGVLKSELSGIMEEMTPEMLAEDVETAGLLLKAIAKSPLLKVLTDDSAEPTIQDLANREMMRDLFGVLYDNDHTRHIFVPLVNVGADAVFKQMDVDPVYSDADLDKVSRKDMLDEADRLYETLLGLGDFVESMDESESAATYRMAEAGKALDSLKGSILFGNRYDVLVRSVAKAGSSADNALMDALADALVKSESAEKLLNSAQSMIVLSDELEKSEAKGRENEKIVSSLNVLLTDTSKADADTLAGLAGDTFTTSGATTETKNQMLEDCTKAMATVSQQGVKDLNVEADAVQVFYDLANSENQNPFVETSEEATVEAMINSQLAQEALKDLNAEGRDYGVRQNLTEENKTKLKAALNASEGDAAAKEAVAIFFGIN